MMQIGARILLLSSVLSRMRCQGMPSQVCEASEECEGVVQPQKKFRSMLQKKTNKLKAGMAATDSDDSSYDQLSRIGKMADPRYSYTLIDDSEGKRCHNTLRTGRFYGNLGKKVEDERKCQELCDDKDGCEYVSLRGTKCTSFSSCHKTQKNVQGEITWKKGPAVTPAPPAVTPAPPADTPAPPPVTPAPPPVTPAPPPVTPVPPPVVPVTPVTITTEAPSDDAPFPLGAEHGCDGCTGACDSYECAQCNLCPSKSTCMSWCASSATTNGWLPTCAKGYCQGCTECGAEKKECKRACSIPNEDGPTSWISRCELKGCDGCDFCPVALRYPKEIVNKPDMGVDIYLGTRELCFESGCAHIRSYEFKEVTLDTRTRRSSTVLHINPTLRVKPGETLSIRYHNTLGAYSPGPDETDTYIGYLNHTNIHTHGLHVSGKKGQDHVLTHIAPGTFQDYNIEIPADHMGGLHWYHDHTHHATAHHLGEGLAGMIVVEDPEGAIPDVVRDMPQHLMLISMLNMPHVKELSEKGLNGLGLHKVPDDSNHVYVNGVSFPTVLVKPGEWNRFRIVFASIEQQLELYFFESFRDGVSQADCEFQLLAKDGIYLHEMPRSIDMIHLFAGARADVAIRCSCNDPPCAATIKSKDTGIWDRRLETYEGDVLELMVDGSPVSSLPLPTVVVNRPCYLANLMEAEVDEKNSHQLHMRPAFFKGGLFPDGQPGGLKWNSEAWFGLTHDTPMPKDEHDLEKTAIGIVPLGDVIEIEVKGADHHPFHMHVNSFQLQDFTLSANEDHAVNTYYKTGDWHDVVQNPSKRRTTTIVRYQTDRFAGEQVIHCHLLEHEDEGMMGWLWIAGEDGKEYAGSEALEPTCYRPGNDNLPGWTPIFSKVGTRPSKLRE